MHVSSSARVRVCGHAILPTHTHTCSWHMCAVYEGLLLSTPDKFTNAEQFLRLWRNEALRVFHDRLICPEDKQIVMSQIAEIVEQNFEPCAAHALADPILFGDYGCVRVLAAPRWACPPLGGRFP